MKVFQERRAQFFALMENNSMAIFPAGSEKTRSNDTEYPFCQNSDFYYLTGFNEPEACLLLIKTADKHSAVLFNREKDKTAEIWQGYRLGQIAAVSDLGFDEAYQIDLLAEHLQNLLDGLSSLYFPVFQDPALDKILSEVINTLRADKRKGKIAPTTYIDSLAMLHEMRLIKSAAEIALLSEAAEISAAGHVRAMQNCHSGMWEFQLQAEVEHEFALQGAPEVAYNSIVAAGENACILHYTENNKQLRDGELVLIDAQISAINQVKPGVALADINKNVIKQLVDGLLELGLLQGDSAALIKDEAYKAFYMHGIGHYLGLDVHDVGDYGTLAEPRLLEAGMVVTIEPGLYVSASADVDDKWKNIGIRIEDDVLVTELGAEVLTADVPKSINEIEALMADAQQHA